MKPKKTKETKNGKFGVPSDKTGSVGKHASTLNEPAVGGLSGHDLIRALRGSCKGKPSLSAVREREHRREDRIKARKFAKVLDLIAKG